ncbi:MAG: SDR family NAD(P)-dependent oxidoreductase [Exilibacterium sp.]
MKQEQNKNESDELIHKYMENRRLEKLAELWVNGIVIDWEKMYEGCQPKRISLPTYPFSEEKYWIAAKNSNEEKSQNKFEPRSLHPLLQHNESNFAEQKYSLILTGDEFFLKHHVVKGIKILPGVVYLEMARAAALHAGSWDENSAIILEEVVWLQPVALRSSSKNVKVRLTQVSSQEATYEIYSDCGPGISETTVSEITASETIPSETIPSEKIVYAEGRISKNAIVTPEVVDIDKLKIKCNKGVLPASDCYSLFKTAGLDYGESQQGIQSVYIGEDKVLAKLNLPSVVKDTLAQYTLHPSIMDSALQASFALLTELANLTDTPTLQLALPYSLDKVEVLSSCKQSMWVLIQYSANNIAESPTQKLDLKIFDQKGKVCVRIYGLTSRKPKQFDEAEYYNDSPIHFAPNESVYTHLVTPVWVQLTSSKLISQDKNYPRLGHHGNQSSVVAILGDETSKMRLTTDFSAVSYLNVDATSAVEEIEIALNEIKSIDHIIWVAKLPNSVISGDSIIDAKNNEILPCLRVIKALLALGYESRVLKWTIITFDAVSVDSGEPVDPRYAGVHGLFGSMAKEYTNWSVGVYDLEDESVWPEQNISLWPEPRGGEVLAYRSKQWYCQRLRSIADDKDLLLDKVRSTDPITYRANGVYVVVGGAGGIGCVWTEMMIRKFQAQVVWIGRQKQGTRITEQIIRLSKLGPAPIYIEADAGNRGSLQAAYMEIKQRFERVNGVINAAIVLRDKTLIAMDEKQFKDCIDAKIDTSVSLVEVFQQEKLDFLLFFSSFSSFSKPAGQSNYAVGCCFQDSYAHFLSQKQLCNAKVINWGYWGKVGVVSSASYRQRKNSIPAVIQNIIALKTFSSNLYS